MTVLPYLALLLVMLITGIYQNRQLQARNTSGSANPQQQALMKVMPFFLPVFSFGFPAGLALYWCTQNFCRIGTNAYITRSIYRKEHEKAPIEATAVEKDSGKDTKKKSVGEGSSNGNGSKGGTSKPAPDRSPGKSVKSQKAHEKAAGERPSGGSSTSKGKSRSVNPRKSGEPRRGSRTEKE